VKVSVDIGVTFHIGNDASRQEDCEKFLYYLGANKLEELLTQECEETIRNFIRRIKVSKIRDIKSELTTTLMDDLNRRFNQYGVYVELVNVMNVIIPKDLRHALQTATTYDVLLQQQVKYQGKFITNYLKQSRKFSIVNLPFI
jgi:regulator of protease activity HflC (stomatin/prohibitin superfamily)